jgi:ubiquinone/menaquinone biosynthesis C-methylase UbiE
MEDAFDSAPINGKERADMKALLPLIVAGASLTLAVAQDHTERDLHEMHRLHQDPKAYIALLEDPKRDAYQKPHEVITALQLREGEVIADIGAGSGYFSFRLARHVGGQGRIYAVDVSPDMIVHLNRRVRDLKLINVVTILCPPDDPLLPDASIDRFFICDTWHHLPDRPRYLSLLKRMLKPGGQVIMIDFKKEKTPVGPPVEMRISRDELVREMEANGFRVAGEHTFLQYQYFIVFQVSSDSR